MPSSGAAAASSSSFHASSSSWSPTNSASSCRSVTGYGSALSSGAPTAEGYTSSLRTQGEVDALRRRYGIPEEFTARLAGIDRRACTPPPPGAVCVYAHALEAGMRVPLPAFFCDVLAHYRLAPSQLMPNGWRHMAGFLVLCRFTGVAPSLAVFRHFFFLCPSKDWYHFRSKGAAGVLFTGLPSSIHGWKKRFFFLSSPTPWTCPVRWGQPPPKSSTTDPELTSEEKKSAAKLLGAHGAAVDLRTYLSEANLAAAFSSSLTGASPPPPATRSANTTAHAKGQSVNQMMQSMPAAAADKVKTDPGRGTSLSGKKRKPEEANADEGPSRSVPNTPAAAAQDCSVSGACPPPRGFSAPINQLRKPEHVPDGHDGDTADPEAARKLLQGIVTPTRERVFAAAKPSDVVASSYISMLQAVNYASFSLGYVLELEEKLMAKERDAAAEAAALREELEKVKDAAGLENAKAAAVRELLGSEEHARHALEGYERGMEDMRRALLRRYPHLDAARLVVPPAGLLD